MQGASDAGLIPMFLPDYQSVTDDGVRSAFDEIWQSGNIASEKGLTVTEIMDAIHDGEISGMYVLGENRQCLIPTLGMLVMRWASLIIWWFRIFS